jgi:ankyrin repeat protein
MVKLLISKGADVSTRSVSEDTALMYTAIIGRADIANLLLEAGADGNVANKMKQTPLMLAAARGHEEFVKMLIEKGVDIELRDYALMSAFDHAQEKGEVKTMKQLLAAGATANLGVDMDQETKDKREISLAKIREENLRKEMEKRTEEQQEF